MNKYCSPFQSMALFFREATGSHWFQSSTIISWHQWEDRMCLETHYYYMLLLIEIEHTVLDESRYVANLKIYFLNVEMNANLMFWNIYINISFSKITNTFKMVCTKYCRAVTIKPLNLERNHLLNRGDKRSHTNSHTNLAMSSWKH